MDTPNRFPRSTILLAAALVVACGSPTPSSPAAGQPSPSIAAPLASPSTTPASPLPSGPPAVRVERAAVMLQARTGFDSVVLGDGTVLVVGDDFACLPGPAQAGSERAERYDAATDTWTQAESLNKPRKSFAMVRLADGRALVVGGLNPDDALYSSTKLFDPTTGSWTDGPLLDVARLDPAAVTIGDGRVIVVSPTIFGETSSTTTTEILDPAARSWSNSAAAEGLGIYTLIPLSDGRVLGIGDAFETDQVVTVFDADVGTWQVIDGPTVLRQATMIALDDGDALAFGFEDLAVGRTPTFRVERFHGATGAWAEVAPMSTRREGAMITQLADGRILVAGGATPNQSGSAYVALATTEIYDPLADSWSAGPDLLESRKDGHARVLADDSVLIFGGDADFNVEGDVPWCPSPLTTVERLYLGS